ncbi:PfkB family carbohydrate kinase [Cellulomonas cellasea]|uniref:Ribokinase n=1 Tax=Cellulomonas cellasea TaxID=43670 RepID=A0A7W4UHR2_9CELL|nr:PfkB family carbohydrate kinase [Cellulomonas cellasea]MBB2924064.1 ribokinase [Cellulomonas cellasea]
MPDVVVVGQVARDLVLGVDALPDAGGSADVRHRRELLGGKGANQAVGCRQLGLSVAIVGVVGDDHPGVQVLREAERDGIDVGGVVRRAGATTALLLDVVEQAPGGSSSDGGVRRLLEDVPDEVLLRTEDVKAAAGVLAGARMVLVQLQQPGPAVLAALDAARAAGVPVLADGAPDGDDVRDAVLRTARVLRADDTEAGQLVGRELRSTEDTVAAARELRERGPAVVALASPEGANVVAWDGGHVVLPLIGGAPADPTGGGDAFVAGLAAALLRGQDPETAGWWGSAAAALTVTHLGGRPDLDLTRVEATARDARREHDGS